MDSASRTTTCHFEWTESCSDSSTLADLLALIFRRARICVIQLVLENLRPVFYLIGCDHRNAQTYRNDSSLAAPENCTQAEFKKLILTSILRLRIDLIAEEANTDILRNTQRQSVVLEAACESGIAHRFCEPTWDEKNELSIEEDLPFFGPCPPPEWVERIPSLGVSRRHDIAHRWPVREEFWLSCLSDKLNRNVLFVCGDAHRWTFRRRLEAKGIQVRLIAKRVGAQALPRDYFDAYREVRQRGFPPSTGCFCISPRPHSSC